MDQEDGNEVEASVTSSEMNSNGTENPVAASIEKSSETNNGEPGNPVEAAKSSEVNTAGTSGAKPRRRLVKLLKAKSAIQKKTSSAIASKAEKVEGNPQIQQKNKKKKRRPWRENKGGNNNNEPKGKNENVVATVENLEKDVAEIDPIEKIQESNNNQDKISGPNENNRKGKRSRKRKKKEKLDAKEDNKQGDENKKEKLDTNENKQGEKNKKEKLGGLIFMCSAKTKPDCFRYQVMGVTSNKKDLVLSVRPGLKLFLYDFDLKLMYGIYKASSAGGMRLEPNAFGGSFPIQVKFSVQRDCVPLHESVFKKAIKDNYNGPKFDIELSAQQVRKLCALFRPVGFQSVQPTAMPVYSREIERPNRDITRSNQPVQAPRDLYMSENEYRTFGLQRVAPAIDPYPRDTDRELPPLNETAFRLREPVLLESRYPEPETYSFATRDPYYSVSRNFSSGNSYLVPMRREEVVSGLGSYYADPIGRREVYGDPIGRRETDEMDMDRVYKNYSVDPTVDYGRVYHPEVVELPPVSARYSVYHPEVVELPPVSARYSFAGASALYR